MRQLEEKWVQQKSNLITIQLSEWTEQHQTGDM